MSEFIEQNYNSMRKRSQGYHAKSFEEYFQKIDQSEVEQEKTQQVKRGPNQRSKSDTLQFIQTLDDYILESSPNQNIEQFIKDKLDSPELKKENCDSSSSDDEENEKKSIKNEIIQNQNSEEEFSKINTPVKLKLMIIGSEKVGKSLLLQNLFKDAQDNESPVKQQSPLLEQQLQKQMSSTQTLDFMIKKNFNKELDRNESYHIWIQNLSNEKNIGIVESCYYGTCDIFLFLFSFCYNDSLQSVIKSYEKVKQIRTKRIFSILVGMGNSEDEKFNNQADDFAEKCTFFIKIDDNNTEDVQEQSKKILSRIQNIFESQKSGI